MLELVSEAINKTLGHKTHAERNENVKPNATQLSDVQFCCLRSSGASEVTKWYARKQSKPPH